MPGARYGLISAAFVVFTLVITDFGLPKVIGGQYNVLAVDIYKQVIGQQNFEMGAVVSVDPADPGASSPSSSTASCSAGRWRCCRRARCPMQPKPNRRFDLACLAWCALVARVRRRHHRHLPIAALVKLWPYD